MSMLRSNPPMILVLAVIVASGCGRNRDDEVAVKTAFNNYKKAILASDGAAAVKLVDRRTLEYYDETRRLALHADAATVRSAGLTDRINILMMRHRIDASVLASMDGPALLKHAVDEGWIGREGVLSIEPGRVKLGEDTAKLLMKHEGKQSSLGFDFHREDGQWKINLTGMITTGNAAMKAAVRKMGLTENEFIFQMLESVSGRKVSETIWDPLQAK